MSEHTKGRWRVSPRFGAVVADHPVPGMSGSEDVEHYGGHLIAESIAPQNLAIIAAAPEMFEALSEIFRAALVPISGASPTELRALQGDILRIAATATLKAEGRYGR